MFAETYNQLRPVIYEALWGGFDDVRAVRRYAKRRGVIIPFHNRVLAFYMHRDRNIEITLPAEKQHLAVYKFRY